MRSKINKRREKKLAKGYYHRSFIILQSKDGAFNVMRGKDSAGYCKMEVKEDRCKMFLYVQDLKPQHDNGGGYDVFLVSADHTVPPEKIARIYTDERGRGECMLEFNINDIYQSGYSLDQFHALAVVYKGLGGIQYPLVGYANKRVELDWVGRVKKNIMRFYDNNRTLSQNNGEDISGQQTKTASDKSYVLEIVERDQEQGTIGIAIRDDEKYKEVSSAEMDKTKHKTEKRDDEKTTQDEEGRGVSFQHKWEPEELSDKEEVREEPTVADLREDDSTIEKDTAQQDAHRIVEKKDIMGQEVHRTTGEEDMAEQDIQTVIEEKSMPEGDAQATIKEKSMSEKDVKTTIEEKGMPEPGDPKIQGEKIKMAKIEDIKGKNIEHLRKGYQLKDSESACDSEETYWDKAKGYFTKLFETHKSVHLFNINMGDEQWVEVPQCGNWNSYGYIGMPYHYNDYYGYPYYDHHIVGLIKEKGKVRYVVYGFPSYSAMPPMFMHGFSRWVAVDNGYGMGYWLLFIDAYTGGIVYPY